MANFEDMDREVLTTADQSKKRAKSRFVFGVLILMVLALAAYGGVCFYHFNWGDGLMPSRTFKTENLTQVGYINDRGEFVEFSLDNAMVSKNRQGEFVMFLWPEK